MNRESNSKTSLFLMELIISILFFSITGAICVRLFVSAHITAQNSVNLSHSVMWAQNLSESYISCDGNLDQMADLYPDTAVLVSEEGSGSGSLLLFLNDDWQLISHPTDNTSGTADFASYEIVLQADTSGKMVSAAVNILDIRGTDTLTTAVPAGRQNLIYSIDVNHYTGDDN